MAFNFNIPGPFYNTSQSVSSGESLGNVVNNNSLQVTQMRQTWTEAEDWIIVQNNNDGTYDLQRHGKTSNGIYPPTLASVKCIAMRGAAQLQKNMIVPVRFLQNGTPYIKYSTKGYSDIQVPVVKSDQSTPPLTFIYVAGLWIQCGGYIWNGYEYLPDFSMFTPGFVSIRNEVTEDFSKTDQDYLIKDTAGTGCKIQLVSPPLKASIEITQITMKTSNGSLTTIFDPINSIILVIPVFHPEDNTLTFTYGAPFATNFADITELHVKYAFVNSNGQTFGVNDYGGASDAITNRGIVAFPDTTPAKSQIVATCNPVLVNTGSDFTTKHEEGTDTIHGDNVYAYPTLSVPDNAFPIDITFNLDGIGEAGLGYVAYAQPANPGVYYASLVFNSAYYGNDATLKFTYTYVDGNSGQGPQNYSETYILGQTQDFSYSVTVYQSDSNPYSATLPYPADEGGFTIENLTQGTNYTNYTSPGVGSNQLSFQTDGITDNGDNIRISYRAKIPVSRVLYASQPITSISGVFVNDNYDGNVTFSGTQFTLSEDSQTGDTVQIQYSSIPSKNQTVTYDLNSGNISFFHTLHVPLTVQVDPSTPLMTNGNPVIYFPYEDQTEGVGFRIFIRMPEGTSVNYSYTTKKYQGDLYNVTGMQILQTNIDTGEFKVFAIPFDSPISATPPRLFTRDIPGKIPNVDPGNGTYYTDNWTRGWQDSRWGYFWYDSFNDCYTVASPEGLHWRNRTIGEIKANGTNGPTSSAVQKATYSTMHWPAELPSRDLFFKGYTIIGQDPVLPLAPNLKRRTYSNTGMNASVDRAFNFTWGTIGPNSYGRTDSGTSYLALGDTDYPIYTYVRNKTSMIWERKDKSISPRSFVKDNAGASPLLIPSCGITQLEAHPAGYVGTATTQNSRGETVSITLDSYPTGRSQLEQLKLVNTCWPFTADAASIVLGIGWCESVWGYDVTAKWTKADYINFPMGTDDSGYTLTLSDLEGAIQAYTTYKADKDYIETSVADPSANVAYIVAHSEADQKAAGWQTFPAFVSGATQGNTYFVPIPSISAVYTPDQTAEGGRLGNWYVFVIHPDVDGPAKKPNLKPAGIPFLADQLPRYSGLTLQNPYGSVYKEDNNASCSIIGDGNNNFYFNLGVPYYYRKIDYIGPFQLKPVQRTFTTQIHFIQPGYPEGFVLYGSYQDAQPPAGPNPFSDGFWPFLFVDIDGTACLGNIVDNHATNGMYPKLDGNYASSTRIRDNSPSTPAGYIETNLTFEAVSDGYQYPDDYHGTGEYAQFPDPNDPYSPGDGNLITKERYEYGSTTTTAPSHTLEMPYRQIYLPDDCTISEHYQFNTPGTPYPVNIDQQQQGNFESHVQGYAVASQLADNRQDYGQQSRTFLIKIGVEKDAHGNSSFVEKYKIDISKKYPELYQTGTYFSPTSPPHTTLLPISTFLPVYFTRPCGRYVFVLRQDYFQIENDGGGNAQYALVLKLEHYDEPTGTYIGYTLIPKKPQIADPAGNGTVDAPATSQYYKGNIPDYIDMQQGIDQNGHEWVSITTIDNFDFAPIDKQYTVRYTDGQEDGQSVDNPHVIQAPETYAIEGYYGPKGVNLQGQAQAVNTYFYSTDEGAVYRKPGYADLQPASNKKKWSLATSDVLRPNPPDGTTKTFFIDTNSPITHFPGKVDTVTYTILASTQGGKDQVVAIAFYQNDDHTITLFTAPPANSIVTISGNPD